MHLTTHTLSKQYRHNFFGLHDCDLELIDRSSCSYSLR